MQYEQQYHAAQVALNEAKMAFANAQVSVNEWKSKMESYRVPSPTE